MQTMPNTPGADVAPFPHTSLVVRHRTWVYAGLLLLVALLLFADRRRATPAAQPQVRASAAGAAASPATQAATHDDRPLLVPDR
jgi:hypothetical protein